MKNNQFSPFFDSHAQYHRSDTIIDQHLLYF